MDTPPPLPVGAQTSSTKKKIGSVIPAHNLRLFIEILVAAITGAIFCFLSHQADPDDNYTFMIPFVIGFLLSIFGRGSVLFIGPATMLVVIIWSPIDLLLLHRVDHPFWPIEMLFYGIMALIGLAGAALGRWIKRWWIKRSLNRNA